MIDIIDNMACNKLVFFSDMHVSTYTNIRSAEVIVTIPLPEPREWEGLCEGELDLSQS